MGGGTAEMEPNLQLFITTREKQYADRFEELFWPSIERSGSNNISGSIMTAIHAIPYMNASFKDKLRPYVALYKTYVDSIALINPYGVPIGLGNWTGGGGVVSFGTTNAFVHKYFPDIVPVDDVFKAISWLFGCHPYHNYSLVASVGAARPKEIFYGNNRADFSFIPGNVAPGILFRRPDHFENYDDWPFLWGQNEGTIGGNTAYLIFGSVFKNILK